MKKIVITLVQGEQKLIFDTFIESDKITEVSGTLAARIIALMVKSRKYKMNLGFSFSRKFDVQISVEGLGEANGTETILNGLMQFGITLGLNEGSVQRFGSFIHELVFSVLVKDTVDNKEFEGELLEVLDFHGIVLS